MGPDAMILVFWKLSFKPALPLSSFTFIKRLFSSSSISAIGVVSSAYLRLLVFLPVILIPAYASSGLAFLMMYSAYKLNKQRNNIQPFLILNQSIVPCLVLTVASWPPYNFFFFQEVGQVVWYSHLFKNLPYFVVINTVKGFRVFKEAEVDIFLKFSCFFYHPTDIGNLISGSSAFSKSTLYIWNFSVHIQLNPNPNFCALPC